MPRTILLVDDNHEILTGVKMRLNAVGFETQSANNASSGIDQAIQQHPDAIVMDVRMPGMNGLQAVSVLQRNEQTKDIPIVILSASLADEESALDAGARYFVRKPYVGKDLIAAITSAIDTSPRP